MRARMARTTWSCGRSVLPTPAASSRTLTVNARTRRASVPASNAVGAGNGCFLRMTSSGKTPRSMVQTLTGSTVRRVSSYSRYGLARMAESLVLIPALAAPLERRVRSPARALSRSG